MARTRQIKPDFFLDEELAEHDAMVRLLFIGLWLLADRSGRLEDRPAKIKAQIFPYNDANVDSMLSELHPVHITRYESGGVRCIQIIKFSKHQHIHPDEKPSILPAPSKSQTETRKFPGQPGDFKTSPEITPVLTSSSPSTSSVSKGGARAPGFTPPSLEEVKAYCQERNNRVDASRFLNFYEAKGWMIGKNKMRSWQAAVRTWEQEAGFNAPVAKKAPVVWTCKECKRGRPDVQPDPEAWDGEICKECAKAFI